MTIESQIGPDILIVGQFRIHKMLGALDTESEGPSIHLYDVNNPETAFLTYRVATHGRYEISDPNPKIGSTAYILKGVDKETGQEVAIKIFPPDNGKGKPLAPENASVEAAIMAHTYIPNQTPRGLSAVTELCAAIVETENGTVAWPAIVTEWGEQNLVQTVEYMNAEFTEPNKVFELIKAFIDCAAALDHIHNGDHRNPWNKITHNDVKARNIMRRKNSTYFLQDFGVASGGQEGLTPLLNNASGGTEGYQPPTRRITERDLYAFTITICEVLTGEFKLKGEKNQLQRENTLLEELNKIYPGLVPIIRRAMGRGKVIAGISFGRVVGYQTCLELCQDILDYFVQNVLSEEQSKFLREYLSSPVSEVFDIAANNQLS